MFSTDVGKWVVFNLCVIIGTHRGRLVAGLMDEISQKVSVLFEFSAKALTVFAVGLRCPCIPRFTGQYESTSESGWCMEPANDCQRDPLYVKKYRRSYGLPAQRGLLR